MLSIASLFWFNRNPDYDIWAMYFFVAYGLGAVTDWSGKGNTSVLLALRLLWLTVVIALLLDFRWRLLLALMTALALHLTQKYPLPLNWRLPPTHCSCSTSRSTCWSARCSSNTACLAARGAAWQDLP